MISTVAQWTNDMKAALSAAELLALRQAASRLKTVGEVCLDPAAALAIECAKGYRKWGRWAADRHARKVGADMNLVRIARQLQAVQ